MQRGSREEKFCLRIAALLGEQDPFGTPHAHLLSRVSATGFGEELRSARQCKKKLLDFVK